MEQDEVTCFEMLPPEMITAVLEYLGDSPDSLLACRLVSTQFKLLIDDMLEKKQLTLWNWSRSYGESKPTTSPGPIRRPSPAGKVFQAPADIDKFLCDMKHHAENALNPFPSGGIYIRRIRSNLLSKPPPVTLEGQDADDDERENVPGIRPLWFFESTNSSNILSTSKILELLQVFGIHLNWMIFECGVTTDLASVAELGLILEQVPNLEYLMLKGIRIEKKKKNSQVEIPEEPQDLPKLENLKSIKIIQCHGITRSILHSYHNQVETLQLLNNRDYWCPHFSYLQRTNEGNIFGKLRELKLGEFENSAEFDYFTTFLQPQDNHLQQQPFQKLERLSIHYAIIHDFAKPIAKLFQMLEYLPKLRELNVGQSSETTLVIDVEEEKAPVKFTCASSQLASISIPVQLYRYPLLLGKVVRNTPTLQQINFLECQDQSSENSNAVELADAMQAILPEFLTMDGFRKVSKMSVVTFHGGNEQVVCTASK